MGSRCLDTIRMYYEDTGWTDFSIYSIDRIKNAWVSVLNFRSRQCFFEMYRERAGFDPRHSAVDGVDRIDRACPPT